MTTTPDPMIVREIAREIILDCGRNADDIGTYVWVRVGADLSKHEHGAWCSAIREAIRTAQIAMSWPDEQPETVPLSATELAELTASIEHLSGPDAWNEDRLESALIPVTHYVPRLLAMVTQEQPQDEREGDVRAAAALAAADDDAELDRAVSDLIARFADRIEALEARDAKGGE